MRAILINRWFHLVILLAMLGGAMLIRTKDYNWSQALRFLAFDAFNHLEPRPVTGEAVIVDIDETSLSQQDLGQWPWSRLVIAKMVKNLKDMGAKAVVFDMLFAEADRTSPHAIMERLPQEDSNAALRSFLATLPDNDEVLARTFSEVGNAVTAFIWSGDKKATRRTPVLTQPILMSRQARDLQDTVPAMIGVATNLPILAKAAAGNGSFGVSPEIDGIIRRVPLLFSFEDPERPGTKIVYPSLAVEALRVSQGPKTVIKIRALKPEEVGLLDSPLVMNVGQYDIPLDWDGMFSLHFSPARHEEYVPAWTVINKTVDPAKIRDKIVFIGTSAEGLKDLRSTPLDLFIPGVEVHVNVVEQVLKGDFLKRPHLLEGVEFIIILVVGFMIIMLAPFTGALSTAALTIVLIAALFAASWYCYRDYGLLLDPVYPSLCITVLFVMSAMLSYIRTEADRRRVKQAFGFYISPDFMEELSKDPDKLRLGGETRDLTVMFTDIRGFTGISESMSPEALIQLMNDFLTPMSDLVMSNRGTIDKYMGDAMMAFWNAPLDDPEHAVHACRAALAMNKALEPINENLVVKAQAERRPPVMLKAGIGINSGPASVGNMGSRQRFAYSAIGDTVNLASRLESQTKNYGASILIGPRTQTAVPGFAALEVDLIRVKGKKEPVRIFALLGDEEYAARAFFRSWNEIHNQMITAYRLGDFSAAERLIGECRVLSEARGSEFHMPEGRMSEFYALYAQRIADLKAAPPQEGWDGVFVATSK